MKAKARTEIEEERNQLLGEVRGQIAALAMAATQKLVGEALDANRQRALIEEFFSGIKDGKVTVVEPAEGESRRRDQRSAADRCRAEDDLGAGPQGPG